MNIVNSIARRIQSSPALHAILNIFSRRLGEQAGVPFKLSFEVMRWTMGVVLWRDGIEEDVYPRTHGLKPDKLVRDQQ